jgi:UDP-glucose 4-epimerase
MKILITGGAGFIGFHLAKHLTNDGNIVVVCDNLFRGQVDDDFASLLQRPNISFVNVDLSVKENLNELDSDFDMVYHLAAINGTRYFYEVPHKVLRYNILLLVNVLDWLNSSQKMVWTSSSEVYAGTVAMGKANIPTNEGVAVAIDDISNPRFSYAASKIAGESLCLSYARAYGLHIVIVRPHNIYGPRMGYDHVIPQFISRILERQNPFKLYGGDQTRAFCFIDDFVTGLRLIGESPLTDGQIINLGNDQEEVSIIDLASRLFDLSGFRPRLENLPAPEGSIHRRCPDITKARDLVGFYPQTNLEAGLRKTYDWYLEHYSPEGR